MTPISHNGSFKAVVVIPAYNHAGTLAAVTRTAKGLGFPVIVVDDGSTDALGSAIPGTATGNGPPLLPAGVTLLRHRTNQGKGAALLIGFADAARIADWAITLDADGQHDPADALALIQAIPEGKRCIVLGHRQRMDVAVAPWTSRFGRGFSNFWVWSAGGPCVADSQSGFRIYPLPETLRLGVKARRYQFEVEVLVRATWAGLPVIEAPVSVDYRPGGRRISHFRPFRDFVRNSEVFNRLIWNRLLVGRAARRRMTTEWLRQEIPS